MLCRSLLVESPASVSFSLLAVAAMAFREMCSVGDAKALLETLAEYAQPALQGAKLQLPEMQRVRLLELIADSLEPGAAEAFDRARAKASPPMPVFQWTKRSRQDEPKLEASGDDAMQGTADAELRTMVAMITGGMMPTGAGMVLLGMSPLSMGPRRSRQARMVRSRRLRLLLQMTRPAPERAVVLLLRMLLRRLRMTASGA